MSDLDTRIRETLDRVADTTKSHSRFDEITSRRRRPAVPRLAVPIVAFAAVVAAFALPMLLTDTPNGDVVSGGPAPAIAPTTIDPSWLTLEPGEVELYNEQSLPGDGDRAPLRSETIWCFYEDARPVESHVVGVTVVEPVTIGSLTHTCANETDVASETDATEESMTVCRGVFDPSEYEQWAATSEMTVVTGDVEALKPGFPVVLGWSSDCVSESLASSSNIALTSDLNLETVNSTRELEVAIVTASIEKCLSYGESEALAAAVVDELGPSYMHVSLAQGLRSPAGCFRPFIDQQWGWVISDIVSGESPDTSTEGTRPPTTLPPTSP